MSSFGFELHLILPKAQRPHLQILLPKAMQGQVHLMRETVFLPPLPARYSAIRYSGLTGQFESLSQFWMAGRSYPPDELHIVFKVLRVQIPDVIVPGTHDVLQGVLKPLVGIHLMCFAHGKEGIGHGCAAGSSSGAGNQGGESCSCGCVEGDY